MQTIIFTGGGSAGHVTPNLALIKRFQAENWHVVYIGSKTGIENKIISRVNIPYYAIATEKIRRYFSWKNFLTPFYVSYGILQAFFICRKIKAQVVFSKGGFVAFPVVVGAWLNRIPIVVHESDLTPGLANRLTFGFAKRICVTFPQAIKSFKNPTKIVVTGTPIRENLLNGDPEKGRAFCGFTTNKPVLLIAGGGLGSLNINNAIRSVLPTLLETYNIVHLCGHGKLDHQFDQLNNYKQYEYLNEELADVLSCADLVVSRAGANSIYELLVLQKPHLLIPLSRQASRGDQIENANYFAARGLSLVREEEQLTPENLLKAINELAEQQTTLKQRLKEFSLPDSIELIYSQLIQSSQ